MPWNPDEFASRHNHKLKGKAARGASEAANKALASGKGDASAIRIGNYVGNKVGGFADGGMIHGKLERGGEVGSMPTLGVSSAYPPPVDGRKQGPRTYGKGMKP